MLEDMTKHMNLTTADLVNPHRLPGRTKWHRLLNKGHRFADSSIAQTVAQTEIDIRTELGEIPTTVVLRPFVLHCSGEGFVACIRHHMLVQHPWHLGRTTMELAHSHVEYCL
jgi:hypothetical protein